MGKPAAGRGVRTLAVSGCALALLALPCSSMACGHSAAAIARSAADAGSRLKPPTQGTGIRVASVIGSGCPPGSVTIHELPNLAGFTATYTEFRAEVSSGNILNFRKNCQFGVRMQAPPGYAYTTVSAQYAGRGKLASGTRGMQLTSYYFQGQPQTVSKSHPMSGPFSGTWRHAEHVALSTLGNAACGQIRILNINAQLIVYPGASVSGPANYLALDAADHGYTTYRFNRTRCSLTGYPSRERIIMLKLAALSAALISCLAVAPASANAAMPDQPHFTVSLLSVNGSGCPLGTTAVSQASDTTFTVTYDSYIASTGTGSGPLDFRKNCQLNVTVGVPSGWTFGITEVDYRGYAHLGRGAHGTLVASYYYPGLSATYRQQHPIYGVTDNDYEFTDRAVTVAYSPCQTSVGLNVNTEIRVYSGPDQSYANEITMDSTDVGTATIYHLGFHRC